MSTLDDLIPVPSLLEVHSAMVAAPASVVWHRIRHGALAQAWPVRALFRMRSALARDGADASTLIRIDDMRSSPDHPGFQILVDHPPCEFAVGAIGKVWRLRIPFVHVETANDYAAFTAPGFVKVAWAVRVTPAAGGTECSVVIEVRVHATDEESWRRFRRYFRVIGPFSRWIRRSLLQTLTRDAARGRSPADARPATRVASSYGRRIR